MDKEVDALGGLVELTDIRDEVSEELQRSEREGSVTVATDPSKLSGLSPVITSPVTTGAPRRPSTGAIAIRISPQKNPIQPTYEPPAAADLEGAEGRSPSENPAGLPLHWDSTPARAVRTNSVSNPPSGPTSPAQPFDFGTVDTSTPTPQPLDPDYIDDTRINVLVSTEAPATTTPAGVNLRTTRGAVRVSRSPPRAPTPPLAPVLPHPERRRRSLPGESSPPLLPNAEERRPSGIFPHSEGRRRSIQDDSSPPLLPNAEERRPSRIFPHSEGRRRSIQDDSSPPLLPNAGGRRRSIQGESSTPTPQYYSGGRRRSLPGDARQGRQSPAPEPLDAAPTRSTGRLRGGSRAGGLGQLVRIHSREISPPKRQSTQK